MRNILGIMLLAAGCQDQSFFVETDVPITPVNGSVMGRVCDPEGRNWLPDAMVYTHLFDSNNKLYDTRISYSDRNGFWLIDELPPNFEYEIYVQFGETQLEQHTVWVGDGEDIVLDEPDCFDPLTLDVAVITGDYDDFEDVLVNMGFANYEEVNGLDSEELQGFLLEGDNLAQYDIIFFNGGHVEEGIIYETEPEDDDEWVPTGVPDLVLENIRNYVSAGGSVYASDWAYDVVEQSWPDRVDFVGADEIPDDAQVGEYGVINAAVSDAALADWLGTNYIDIEYDLPVWPPITNVAESVSTHVAGSVEYRDGQFTYSLAAVPLMVSFGSGEGKVAFSTFRMAKNGSQEVLLVLQYMMYNL